MPASCKTNPLPVQVTTMFVRVRWMLIGGLILGGTAMPTKPRSKPASEVVDVWCSSTASTLVPLTNADEDAAYSKSVVSSPPPTAWQQPRRGTMVLKVTAPVG